MVTTVDLEHPAQPTDKSAAKNTGQTSCFISCTLPLLSGRVSSCSVRRMSRTGRPRPARCYLMGMALRQVHVAIAAPQRSFTGKLLRRSRSLVLPGRGSAHQQTSSVRIGRILIARVGFANPSAHPSPLKRLSARFRIWMPTRLDALSEEHSTLIGAEPVGTPMRIRTP